MTNNKKFEGIVCKDCKNLIQSQYDVTGNIHIAHLCTTCKENIQNILHLEKKK